MKTESDGMTRERAAVKTEKFAKILSRMQAEAPAIPLANDSKIVIMSDFHLGDGTSRDDSVVNKALLESALSRHYLGSGFTLFLNGDIEEMQKFRLASITHAHENLFSIFRRFLDMGRLYKTVGNHDGALVYRGSAYQFPVAQCYSLEHEKGTMLVFHGHQASSFFMNANDISGLIVRYLASPLRIRNGDVPASSKRRFVAERRIYKASKSSGVVSVIGHTHRPVFETMSKYDSLKVEIERLLAAYPGSDSEARKSIEKLVALYASEFRKLSKWRMKKGMRLYSDDELVVPCLFNSGCATGAKGITALEIEKGEISLVFWTDAGRENRYIEREAVHKSNLPGTTCVRYTLRRESLDSIFLRVKLLGTGENMPKTGLDGIPLRV